MEVCEGAPLLAAAASVLAVLAAMNALNAFDNADGAATSIGILGLGLGVPVRAGPLLGFLPWNLLASRGGKRAPTSATRGAFVLGVLLSAIRSEVRAPPAAPRPRAPRFVRTSVGSRPWSRGPAAPRAQAAEAGLSNVPVVLVLAAVAARRVIGSRSDGGDPRRRDRDRGPRLAAVLLTPRIG
jgi:hypothetical protein